MKEYEEISKEFRFGKVKKEFWNKHIQKKVKAIIAYMQEERGLEIEGVYLENYKTAEPVIVMNGPLPLEAIESKFSSSNTLEYSNNKIYSTTPWVTIEGML
ncbi:MAG: hypothetical protein ACKE5M_07505 [Methylophilaceae bacterium]